MLLQRFDNSLFFAVTRPGRRQGPFFELTMLVTLKRIAYVTHPSLNFNIKYIYINQFSSLREPLVLLNLAAGCRCPVQKAAERKERADFSQLIIANSNSLRLI